MWNRHFKRVLQVIRYCHDGVVPRRFPRACWTRRAPFPIWSNWMRGCSLINWKAGRWGSPGGRGCRFPVLPPSLETPQGPPSWEGDQFGANAILSCWCWVGVRLPVSVLSQQSSFASSWLVLGCAAVVRRQRSFFAVVTPYCPCGSCGLFQRVPALLLLPACAWPNNFNHNFGRPNHDVIPQKCRYF